MVDKERKIIKNNLKLSNIYRLYLNGIKYLKPEISRTRLEKLKKLKFRRMLFQFQALLKPWFNDIIIGF